MMVAEKWVVLLQVYMILAVALPAPLQPPPLPFNLENLAISDLKNCIEADLSQIEELKTQLKNVIHPFDEEEKSNISFGLLDEDWKRLRLLESRLPKNSILRTRLLKAFRILILAIYQAHGREQTIQQPPKTTPTVMDDSLKPVEESVDEIDNDMAESEQNSPVVIYPITFHVKGLENDTLTKEIMVSTTEIGNLNEILNEDTAVTKIDKDDTNNISSKIETTRGFTSSPGNIANNISEVVKNISLSEYTSKVSDIIYETTNSLTNYSNSFDTIDLDIVTEVITLLNKTGTKDIVPITESVSSTQSQTGTSFSLSEKQLDDTENDNSNFYKITTNPPVIKHSPFTSNSYREISNNDTDKKATLSISKDVATNNGNDTAGPFENTSSTISQNSSTYQTSSTLHAGKDTRLDEIERNTTNSVSPEISQISNDMSDSPMGTLYRLTDEISTVSERSSDAIILPNVNRSTTKQPSHISKTGLENKVDMDLGIYSSFYTSSSITSTTRSPLVEDKLPCSLTFTSEDHTPNTSSGVKEVIASSSKPIKHFRNFTIVFPKRLQKTTSTVKLPELKIFTPHPNTYKVFNPSPSKDCNNNNRCVHVNSVQDSESKESPVSARRNLNSEIYSEWDTDNSLWVSKLRKLRKIAA